MYPYPPRYINWEMEVCSSIIPGILLVILLTVAFRNRSARRWIAGGASVVIVLWMLANALFTTGNAREAARRTACRNNLKRIAAAIHKYHDEHHRLPPPVSTEKEGPTVSWRIDLLPYTDAKVRSAAQSYRRDAAWDDLANLAAARQKMDIYRCPANRTPQDAQHRWYTAYAFLTEPGTAFPDGGPLTLDDITDGTSNTLLIVEACGRNIVWTEPRDVNVSRETFQVNAPGDQRGTSAGIASSYHEEGAQVALADGSVRFVSETIDASVLRALTTAAEEDSIGEF